MDMILNNPEIEPSDKVLEEALGSEVFEIYREALNTAIDSYELIPTWRFYKDGKSWLCKVQFKKKTIFWLSIWDGMFKTTFYLTEKTKPGIFDLDISQEIKDSFRESPYFGKVTPLTLEITQKDQLNDFGKIIRYKKSLK